MEENSKEYFKGLLTGVLAGIIVVLVVITGMKLKNVMNVDREDEQQTSENKDTDMEDIVEKIQVIYKRLDDLYLNDIDMDKMEDAICKAMVSSLGDVYTTYYNEEDLTSMMQSVSGSYCGIGVTVGQDAETNRVFVNTVFSKSPAYESGIRSGDEILSIDGKEIGSNDLNTITSWVKGEEGSHVQVVIKRNEETLEFDITRKKVEIDTVYSQMLEDHIGYIQILEFDQITTSQFLEAVEELQNQGMEKIILDLRDNPGGSMDVVCDIANTFLEEDKLILYTEDKHGDREEEYSHRQGELVGMPVVVLVNGNSASAAELLTGVVRDYDIGKVVGTQTFGKGIAQRLVQLPGRKTALKITYSKYYTPGGINIHKIGIEPDEVVPLPGGVESIYELDKDAEDPQLQKAIELLK